MVVRKACWVAGAAILCLGALFASRRPFREYPGLEYNNFPLPADWQEESEWVFARLMYPSAPTARFVRRWGRHGWNWLQGETSWTQDYPRADRHFAAELRRLTRVHARSAEQPVNLDDGDDVFHYPWLYAVQVGEWNLTDAQAQKLREYLLRGGFFLGDDLWGAEEWAVFEQSMKRVFPDRPIVKIEDSDSLFRTIFSVDEKYQIPPFPIWARTGRTTKCEGCVERWRGIYDDQGRLMVAVMFNSDMGDSWEFEDDPRYPEPFTSLGVRFGVNSVVYAMTH